MTVRALPLILGWIALTLFSCKEVVFPEPQPTGVKALTEVPSAIRGRYVAADTSDEKKDTLIVESWGYHFKDSNDKGYLNRGVISDSLVIKFYRDYYFVNFRSEDGWILRILRQQPSGSLEFLFLNVQDANKEADLIAKLSSTVEVKKIEVNGDTFYQMNPTRKQLMSFIAHGYFTGEMLLERK